MFSPRVSGISAAAAFVFSLLIGLLTRTSMPSLIIRALIFAVVFFAVSALVYYLAHRFLPELTEDGGGSEDITDLLPGSRVNIVEGDTSADYSPSSAAQSTIGARPDDSGEGMGSISDLLKKNAGFGEGAEDASAPSTGMDQNTQDGYTKMGEGEAFSSTEPVLDSSIFDFDGKGFGFGASSSPKETTAPREMTLPKETAAPKEATAPRETAAPRETMVPKAPPARVPAASTLPDFSDSEDTLPDLDSMAGAFMSASAGVESGASDFSGSAPSHKPLSGASKAPEWAEEFNAKDMARGIQTKLNKEEEG